MLFIFYCWVLDFYLFYFLFILFFLLCFIVHHFYLAGVFKNKLGWIIIM